MNAIAKLLIVIICSLVLLFLWSSPAHAETIRIMTANLTSGNQQSYDVGEGIRIFQGLKPDIVLIQEWNYGDNSPQTIRKFVDRVFGKEYSYFREPDAIIPNGIISKFPLIKSQKWDNILVTNRDFAYARIKLPGSVNLSAISVHFLTKNESIRQREAEEAIEIIDREVPSEDYLVIGGDFNTKNHQELALKSLNRIVKTTPPYPVDNRGKIGTNASRTKPYDGIYVDPDLALLEIPVAIGEQKFPHGLVFDSRVYEPLVDVSPIQKNDSGAVNMQHMAIIKDFKIE
jgi:endonuclease/exonuclease/phosphatase family metal-dependent hydrolase